MTDAPAIPVPSATVLLLRDGVHGLEVFMVLRNAGIDFAGGALVYPGGKSDPADLTEETAAYCDGVDGLDLVEIGNRVCGIRETFEEAGFLLAREKGRGTLVSGDRCLSLGAQYRKAPSCGRSDDEGSGCSRGPDARLRFDGALRPLDHAREIS